MILHAQAKHGKPGLPWLVFLHGFSGDCHEWQEVGEAFADYSRLYVDLPGHGGSAAISVDGFDDVTDLLRKTLVSYNASMDLMMSPAYCVKPWLVTTSLTSGWWGTRLADGWR